MGSHPNRFCALLMLLVACVVSCTGIVGVTVASLARLEMLVVGLVVSLESGQALRLEFRD